MLHELPKKALRSLFGGNISTTQVLQTIASGMADCGVDVVIDPRITVPMADPLMQKIYLPSQVRSERALLVVSWYLDHEAAHIMYTPDLRPTIERWEKEGPVYDVCVAEGYKGVPMPLLKAVKGVLNISEDSRIEHLLSERLPGCKRHFLNGPVAAGLEDLVEDVYEKAKEIQEEQGKDHTPLSPFWVAEMHAYAILDGWHGQKSKQYVRELLPEHVHWVMDIIDDEFGDIKDVTTTTFDSLVDRTETAMAKIIKKVLEDAQEVEGGGDGGQPPPQQENPFQDEFTKSKDSSGEGEGEDDGEGGEGEQENQESGQGSEEQGDEQGEASDESSGSEDEDSDGGESSGESGGASEDEGEDNDDESSEGSDGSESGEREGSEGDSGSGSSDESDDAGSDGSESGDQGEDGDDDTEEQSGGGASDGSEDAEGDDGDDDGESDSGSGDEELDDDWDAEGEDEGDEAEDSDDTGSEDSPMDGEDEGEDGAETEGEEEESHLEEGDGQPKQLPQQVEEWANDADVDMADLIRQGHEHELAQEAGEGGSDERPQAGGSPNVPHNASSENMPEAYYDNLAPGLRTIVIDGVNMNNFVDEHQSDIFAAYDQFVRDLMPPNLGPAARKLVGKFKGAPGPAYAGNRVNPRLLAPIQAGKAGARPLMLRRNDTVYSRKGVSVMVLLDCSGSMCEGMRGLDLKEPAGVNSIKEKHGYSWREFASKFVISHAAIRSLARVFQQSGVPFAVGGFTTAGAKYRTTGSAGRSVSRGFDIVNLMFKDFHEPWASSEQKMIAMNPFTQINFRGDTICSHANSDGESLLWAATKLLQREEDIKVLIVASDGLPANGGAGMYGTAFLKYVVNRIELADVHIGALGIGCTGVKHYYRIHELIDEFPEGRGTEETAPLYVQDKVIRLVDRLMTEGGNPNVAR
jgi:hypothetical protein